MSQFYTEPERETDPHALPDAETFRIPEDYQPEPVDDEEPYPDGWYWWSCFPGCIPDGDPNGSFLTAELAIADAQDGN